MCLFSHQSLVLFSRQSLAVVVVIVYGFDRHFALPLSFFSRRFFPFSSSSSASACMHRRGGGGLLRPYISSSIHFLPTSFFFFFFFFSLLTYNGNWHEKLEMTEKRRWRHSSRSIFLHGFFFFLLRMWENASTYFSSRLSFYVFEGKNRKGIWEKETEHHSIDVALSFWIKMWEANKIHGSICLFVLFSFYFPPMLNR